jgi:anti-sigma regulatory factor (Ser/Thr protein kinase)
VTTSSQSFQRDPRSVGEARRFAKRVLRAESESALEAIELMVSELATNSVRHAGTGFRITIVRSGAEVRIEITDCSGARPELRSPRPEDPHGRGLRIVDMLSDTWGVDGAPPAGKTVWFTVARSA